MMWLMLACSSQETANIPSDAWTLDSGLYSTADTASELNDAEEPDSSFEEPSWMKISLDINITDETLFVVNMKRDLYTENMTWICQQDIQVTATTSTTPLLSDGKLSLRLSEPNLLNTGCLNLRDEESIELFVGDLLPNVAVATEVTHWLDGDQYLETEVMWGAYVQMSGVEDIWAFGIAMQPSETDWVIRTVYSLPW